MVGGVVVQSADSSSVEKTEEEQSIHEEEDFNDLAYAQAMIAAMSAIGENLSKTIDAYSQRSVLLKKLADSSIRNGSSEPRTEYSRYQRRTKSRERS